MSDFRKPVYASGRLELAFAQDVGKGLAETFSAAKNAKVATLALIALQIVDSFDFRVPGIAIATEVAVVYIAYGMIRKMWAELNAQNCSFTAAEFKGAEAKMVGVSILYGIYCLLLALLLIFPAVWWGVRNCLGIVIAAIENLKPIESLKRSEALVKGNFWLAFRYAFGGPILILLGLFGSIAGATYAVYSAEIPQDTLKVVDFIIAFAGGLSASMWQLLSISLLVRLYAYLKWQKAAELDDPVNKGFKPSEPRWEIK